MIEHFSTDSVDADRRRDFWNELVGATYDGLVVDPVHPHFAARMARWRLPDLVMTRPRSAAAAIARRRNARTSSTANGPVLHVLHSGSTRLLHRNKEVLLEAGDAVICSSGEFYQFDVAQDHEILVAELPRAVIATTFDGVDDFVAKRLPGGAASVRVLHNFLLSLWREAFAGLEDEAAEAYGPVIGELLVAIMRNQEKLRSPRKQPLFSRMQGVVEARLADVDLDTKALAEELGVSIRTLQCAAADAGTTPRVYLLNRRLQRGAELLRMEDSRSIKEIAHWAGFADGAYFARCFRKSFGVSPTDYRRGDWIEDAEAE
jgi:AraC-like DNA-binding protein